MIGSLRKNVEKRGNGGKPNRDGNVRDDHKRSRTGSAFASTTNPGSEPSDARNPTAACRTCFECGGTDHYRASCPRLNQAPGQGGIYPNQAMAIEGGQGHGNNGDPAGGRDFVMGIDCHTFDIDLIPFGHGSFDVIVGMDWLSRHMAEIVCHEKVVRIPLPNGKILRVLGEKPEDKMKHLMSAKTEEQKLEDIVIVRNFPDVFPADLSGLPPSREFEFHIDLIPGATP
ncbi:putative reverse transcriptase domain-containing protein, partial [Tanacetum coccineum]